MDNIVTDIDDELNWELDEIVNELQELDAKELQHLKDIYEAED